MSFRWSLGYIDVSRVKIFRNVLVNVINFVNRATLACRRGFRVKM